MDRPLEILTYSSGTCLCLCEQKYRLRHERCLRPKRDEQDTRDTGRWMHVGLETYRERGLHQALAAIDDLQAQTPAIGPDVFKVQQRAARARAMVQVAADRWPADNATASEQVVSMALINPETGAASRTFTYAGVVDGVDGDTLIDWKAVTDPTEFIESKTIGYQTELYIAALQACQGIQIRNAVFRLVTIPSIRFCNKDGGSQRLYEERCLAWLREEPSRLVEHEMWADPGRIAEAKHWLWSVSKRILENRRTGRWLRNEYACRTWNRTCEYMPICRAEACGADAEWIAGESFEVVDDAHPELTAAAQKGGDLKTMVTREVQSSIL